LNASKLFNDVWRFFGDFVESCFLRPIPTAGNPSCTYTVLVGSDMCLLHMHSSHANASYAFHALKKS